MTNEVDRIYGESREAAAFADGYLAYLTAVLGKINRHEIAHFIDALQSAHKRDATVFFLGNGGSAATASHFANDLSVGTRAWRRPFRVVSLTDNVPVLTALANDYSYDEIFTRQLMTLMRPTDVVVAISVSGNSPNVVKAIELANERGAVTIGLTGFDGGRLRTIASMGVHVPTNRGEYGPAEDAHMVLDHLVSGFISCCIRDEIAS